MTLIEKAIDLALRAHSGQTRKYSGFPYIIHPAAVASAVAVLPNVTENEIAAAWLHDVLEDCDEKYCQELLVFPEPVVKLVKELTNPSKDSKLPRKERKQMDRDHLKNVSFEGKCIKLLDRILNLGDMNGASLDFVKLYCDESEALLEVLKGTWQQNDIMYLEKRLRNAIFELKYRANQESFQTPVQGEE